MAFRATRYWRSMLNGMGVNHRSFASSTTPKMKLFAATADAIHVDHAKPRRPRAAIRAEFAPVYIVLGMIMVAMSIGAHTAKQQLFHAPAVQVKKKKRESVPEVDDPDTVVRSSDKFVNKSFLRKVAHIQDTDPILPDPLRPDPFTSSREVESLKSVGVHIRGN